MIINFFRLRIFGLVTDFVSFVYFICRKLSSTISVTIQHSFTYIYFTLNYHSILPNILNLRIPLYGICNSLDSVFPVTVSSYLKLLRNRPEPLRKRDSNTPKYSVSMFHPVYIHCTGYTSSLCLKSASARKYHRLP